MTSDQSPRDMPHTDPRRYGMPSRAIYWLPLCAVLAGSAQAQITVRSQRENATATAYAQRIREASAKYQSPVIALTGDGLHLAYRSWDHGVTVVGRGPKRLTVPLSQGLQCHSLAWNFSGTLLSLSCGDSLFVWSRVDGSVVEVSGSVTVTAFKPRWLDSNRLVFATASQENLHVSGMTPAPQQATQRVVDGGRCAQIGMPPYSVVVTCSDSVDVLRSRARADAKERRNATPASADHSGNRRETRLIMFHAGTGESKTIAVLRGPWLGTGAPSELLLTADGGRLFVGVDLGIARSGEYRRLFRRLYAVELDDQADSLGAPTLEITTDSSGEVVDETPSDARIVRLQNKVPIDFNPTQASWSVSRDGETIAWRVQDRAWYLRPWLSAVDTIYIAERTRSETAARIELDLSGINDSVTYLHTQTTVSNTVLQWTPGGDRLLVVSRGRLWAIHSTGQRRARPMPHPGRMVKDLLYASNQDALVSAVDVLTGRQGVWWIGLATGEWRPGAVIDASISGAIAAGSARDRSATIAYSSSTFAAPPNIYVMRLTRSGRLAGTPRQITDAAVNPPLPGAERLIVRYRAGANHWGTAVILRRSGTTKPLPTIVWAYPGDVSSVTGAVHNPGLLPWGDVYAALDRGYAVMLADIPMTPSGVYGDQGPAGDVVAGMTAALDRSGQTGWVDTSRVGVIGHSYGGTMVGILVTRTRRFGAAVAVSGLMDFVSAAIAGTRIGPGFFEGAQGRLGTSLENAPERYVRNSPVFHLDDVTTPLLLVNGVDDNTTHISQSEEMFRGLAMRGKNAELVRVQGATHFGYEFLDYAWMRALDWFDEHLR